MPQSPFPSPRARDPLQLARITIWCTLILALAGSITGLTLGHAVGAVTGFERILVAGAALFCGILIVILAIRPFDRLRWLAPLISAVFLAYLVLGGLASLHKPSIVDSFLVYLLWFFPLLAFNRFANLTTSQVPLTWLIWGAALALSVGALMVQSLPEREVPVLLVYGMSLTTFTLLLSLFAWYREALIKALEREQAAAAAHQTVLASERRFRDLFVNAASGIGWLDADGVLHQVNATFARMLNRSVANLEQVPFVHLVAAESRDTWDHDWLRLSSGADTELLTELRLRGNDGAQPWTRISLAVRRNPDANLHEVVFVCLDNTEVHDMSARLHQAQRLEAVGQLTGGVAHDFNNLLTVILGNADVLVEDLAGRSRQSDLARMIRDAAMRGHDLVQRLLAFARRQVLDPRHVRVARQLDTMLPLLRRSIGEDIAVDYHADDRDGVVLLDPAQFESAVLNLCLNARDAMPLGGQLSIAVGRQYLAARSFADAPDLPAGNYLQVTVTDTGQGIEPEALGRLFEPFYTTKALGKGTGLGLPMVHGFMQQSGGHITVESVLGQGTAVHLWLPLVSVEESRVGPAPIAVSTEAVPGGTETILLVEDDPLVRDHARGQLESLGYRVHVASDGVEALAALRDDDAVALLFTDVIMPEMSGVELAQRVQARHPGIRVLFTSGYAENVLVHRGQLPEGVRLLSKPYRRQDLARKIRDALEADREPIQPLGGSATAS